MHRQYIKTNFAIVLTLSGMGVSVWARRREDEDPDFEPITCGAASYSRSSSQLQDERSISDQQRKCRSRATSDGLEILSELEFFDEASSGAKHDRAGFEALMAAARAGRIRTVYFENLSRLARDCVLTLQTLRELVYVLKVRIVSIDEGIDSATNESSWELLAAILGLQNEQYLRSLAKFVFRGQEGVVLDSLCVGDYCFGFGSEPIPGSEMQRKGRNPKPKKRYIIIPEEAAWVSLIFEWFVVEKRSLNWIAKELTKRGAPKDHRSTTREWRHDLLPGLLKNRKYIGYWPWGTMKNVRNPLTGKVRQEPRSPVETEKWLRHFPQLQLIDDETFAKAQAQFEANEAALAACRKPVKGKRHWKSMLAGSTSQASETWPRHLLSGLVGCGKCGSKYQVGGKMSRYMFCPGYRSGVCDCKTTLRRDLAEELTHEAIGSQILADHDLVDVVERSAQEGWNRAEHAMPSELNAVEKELAEVELRISRLLKHCEEEDVPALGDRLRQRCAERDILRAKRDCLSAAATKQKTPPTREWNETQLLNLRATLSGGGPAAALALRKLLDDRIGSPRSAGPVSSVIIFRAVSG